MPLALLAASWPTSLESWAADLPQERIVGRLEVVHTFTGAMPTGVTVSREDRIFVNFPRWGDKVPFTVAEIRDGRLLPYPNAEINQGNTDDPANSLLSVQSVVVGPNNRLWILDTGRIEHQSAPEGGPKLVSVDLRTNKILKTIVFPRDVALPTTYLNDVRFDPRRGAEGMAFITDSSEKGPNAIIVVDLASGKSWRRLNNHPSTRAEPGFLPFVEGRPLKKRPAGGKPDFIAIGADGIAMGSEGKRLFYCPLASRHLYSVSVDALADPRLSDSQVAETVVDHGQKGASDGLESDSENRVYVTNYEQNAIHRRNSDGSFETLVHNPHVLWPDTLSLADDGYLYFIVNQLHRQPSYHQGRDLREKPYVLFRVKTDAQPVRLAKEGEGEAP
jgi:sugar lactone lactonase YvrE